MYFLHRITDQKIIFNSLTLGARDQKTNILKNPQLQNIHFLSHIQNESLEWQKEVKRKKIPNDTEKSALDIALSISQARSQKRGTYIS